MPTRDSHLPLADWLADFCRDAFEIEVSDRAASVAELDAIERELGAPLPPSYRHCLQQWDGAENFCYWKIFSIAELRNNLTIFCFQAESDEPLGAEEYFMYRGLPRGILVFGHQEGLADVAGFDTRSASGGEWPIVRYDHETGELDAIAADFGELMRDRALDAIQDLELFIDPEDPATEERCEPLYELWRKRLS
ncbi:MAG: SMI1/KNR4 family protein [Geitlerinemataceae cyanobacterium]